MAAEYQGRRDRVVERLRGIQGCRAARARGGIVRDGRRPRTGSAVRRVRRFLLNEAGVVVLHGSAYGPGRRRFLCGSASPREARCSNGVSSGCGRGCCDSRLLCRREREVGDRVSQDLKTGHRLRRSTPCPRVQRSGTNVVDSCVMGKMATHECHRTARDRRQSAATA